MCRVSPFISFSDSCPIISTTWRPWRNGPSVFSLGRCNYLNLWSLRTIAPNQAFPDFLQTCRAIVKGLLKKQELRLGLVRVSRHGKLRCGFVVVGSKDWAGHLSFVLRVSSDIVKHVLSALRSKCALWSQVSSRVLRILRSFTIVNWPVISGFTTSLKMTN